MYPMYSVSLEHVPNPDIRYSDYPGYWDEPQDSGARQWVDVATLAEASRVCRAYIDRNGLGGANWNGGSVCLDGQIVATVSYNGRVWDLRDEEIPIWEDDPETGIL